MVAILHLLYVVTLIAPAPHDCHCNWISKTFQSRDWSKTRSKTLNTELRSLLVCLPSSADRAERGKGFGVAAECVGNKRRLK